MKILHLFSNWKWTGPAEPALHVAAEQARRGHDVTMAVGDAGGGERHFHDQVRARGVKLLEGMRLRRHFELLPNLADVRFLARHLAAESYDALCCHMANDHWIASRARPRALPIVRASYDPEGPATGLRGGRLMRRATDALVVASPLAELAARRNFPHLADRVFLIEPGIDTERFDAARELPDRRAELGIPADAFVVGLVARVQARRRFDTFLQAVAELRETRPETRALILGTASPQDLEEILGRPGRALGLDGLVQQLGRQRGDAYVALLRALDVLVYLVPGSDGSCRAVREGMSMGLPVLAARRGMLPEILADGETGVLFGEAPGELGRALVELAQDPDRRRALGAAAARAARERFALGRLGDGYEQVLQRVAAPARSS